VDGDFRHNPTVFERNENTRFSFISPEKKKEKEGIEKG